MAELGRLEEARRLADLAVTRSPGVPTRYLFARDRSSSPTVVFDDVRRTAAKILEGALPPGARTAPKRRAAAYLTGLALLAEEKAGGGARGSVAGGLLEGLRVPHLPARARRRLSRSRKMTEALAAAKQSGAPLDPADPRLDLELDRMRAP
jgi:hypothetical protein